MRSYTFDVIRHAVRALSASIKVSIRIDSEGVMSLQFLMPAQVSGESATWIEFKVGHPYVSNELKLKTSV